MLDFLAEDEDRVVDEDDESRDCAARSRHGLNDAGTCL